MSSNEMSLSSLNVICTFLGIIFSISRRISSSHVNKSLFAPIRTTISLSVVPVTLAGDVSKLSSDVIFCNFKNNNFNS